MKFYIQRVLCPYASRSLGPARPPSAGLLLPVSGPGSGEVTDDALTPAQMFAARQLLRWTRKFLAARIPASFKHVRSFEVDGRVEAEFDPRKAREVLEAAGVEFIVENGDGAAVRLRGGKPRSSRQIQLNPTSPSHECET